jgi:glycine/D-amino acid oxidase-like deaminating enzyme/nitrite reductase/ring-hydroxylating ferredoxin subunit
MAAPTLWQKGLERTSYPPLVNDMEADVVVIGGGITGVTTAYLLSGQGKRVVLLEKDRIGSRETANTTAFLNYPVDAELFELKNTFGEKNAVRVWKSAQWAIDQMEDIISREEIDCDFIRCPLYMYATDESQFTDLQNEYSLAHHHRFPVNFEKIATPFIYEDFFEADYNAKFHPLKYLTRLAWCARENGALIFEDSEVTGFSGHGPVTVETKQARIVAQDVVFATHIPTKRAVEIDTRVIPYQTYIIVVKIPKGAIAEAMYIDMEDPYHYFRIDKNDHYDLLTLGGEDHETGKNEDADERHHRLEVYLKKLMPQVSYQVMYRWSGEIFDTIDGLPFIGRSLTNRHHLYSTGYAGDGMVFGTLGAFIMTDLILERENEWADLYRVDRLKEKKALLKRGVKFGKELVKGRLGLERISFENIPLGTGKVIKCNGSKIAVYRDEMGGITKLSPVCRHMGCFVDWNDEGKTWDCPCHGSRYDKHGEVLNGPTQKPLRKMDEAGEGEDLELGI